MNLKFLENGGSMNLKAIANEAAKECGYLQELQMLENLYPCRDYRRFLELLSTNAHFSLYEIEVLPRYSTFFNKNVETFKKWLENETFSIGRESVLSFLEKDLNISFDDFLYSAKEVKEKIVQGFVYSVSTGLYDYFYENETLREFLK